MSTLYGRKPSDTFSALLKMNRAGDSTATGSDPGITNTLAVVEDGLGNSTPLKLSATTVAINEMLWPTIPGDPNTVLTVGAGNQLSWSPISSSNVIEGTNQYFTQARARASISAGSGITYTAATGVISAAVTSVNSKTGAVSLTTSDVAEGTNQYFTQARARSAIGVSGDLAYNATTGVISFTATPAPVTSVFGRTGAVTLNSLDVTTALGYTPVDVAQKNIPGGFAGLDATGKVPFSITGNAATATNIEWSGILNKPTTLDTYGITDAYPLAGLQTGTVKLPTAVVYETIVPAVTKTIDLGSSSLRFRSIYVDEAYLSTNTLYLGDTPVMGTDQDTVNIKADPNQSITVKTIGNGLTSLISEKGVTVSTSGMNADVVVQASGSGSKVRFGSMQTIDLTSPEVMVYGNNTVSGNSSVGGNLTVTGNLVVNGSQFLVNATTVSTKDNIIVVNSGEVGSGVTSGKAGIQVDRGEMADYQILFDEVDDLFKVGMVGQLETIASRPWVTTNFAPVSHQHGDADLTAISWSKVTGKPTNLSGYGITDAQPLDGDLTAIAGLVETSGFLKKTAANTWALDTNAYLTGNQTVTISGDASGSGTTSIALTLANSGVTAGTYNNSATAITPIVVDAKGRVTGTGAAVTITPAFSSITGKPTTLSGYGITDSQPLDADLTAIAGLAGTSGILKKTAANTWALDTNTYLTGNQTITATGDVTGSGTTSIAMTLASTGVTAGTYRSVTVDAKGRVTAGTNPTTLSGYGITDAVNSSLLGAAGGVATLDASGLVPASQLPSYVDDVLEYTSLAAFPLTGETGKIYVAQDTSKIYRWSGSTYIEISPVAGNSDTATKLATARTISASGDASWSVSFDGSANVTAALTLANSGATAGTYKSVTVDAKGRVTAGTNPTTLSGYGITDAQPLDADLTAIAALTATGLVARTADGAAAARSIAVSGTGLSVTNADGVAGNPTVTSNATSANTASTVVARDASGNFTAGTITAALTGNASTSTKLATARTLSVSGDATGSASFDGSANAAIALTLANSGATAGTYRSVTVDAKGRVTAGTNPTTLAGYGITDAVSSSLLGAANGVATLDASGLVPASQLPSYVDDVLEYASLAALPVTGESGKIYVAQDSNKIYRWSGSAYIEISPVVGNSDTATKLATARTLSATGDASWSVSFDGSANVTAALTLAASGATAGTYRSVTVDAKGRVTAGTNPTTLSGYGITDAQPLDADLTAIAGLAGTSGILKKTAANSWDLDTNTYLTGNQTVTISGDATGSGTTSIALTLANSGVTAGTYTASTVDAKGRVTAGANMTITGDVSGTAFGASIAVALAATGVTAGTYTVSTVDAKGRVTNGSNLSATGDVTGTASGSSIALTLSNSGVTAGTYNNSATTVTPITVDAKGRVTGTGAAVTITPAFSSITGKPTTLAGYGITDAISTNGTLPMTNADIGSSAYVSSLVATGQIIDSVSASAYRSVKYLVQATSGTDYAVTEILLIHNGTTVTITEYGNVRTNQAANFVQYDADISGGNIRLLAQTFNASTTFKVVKTMIDA